MQEKGEGETERVSELETMVTARGCLKKGNMSVRELEECMIERKCVCACVCEREKESA